MKALAILVAAGRGERMGADQPKAFVPVAGQPMLLLAARALGAAPSPQGFRVALLRRAYDKAFRDDVVLTDEAMALERLGEPVMAVKGSARNRKLTTPEDLAWAESLLLSEGHP